jgi:hypothetical protein
MGAEDDLIQKLMISKQIMQKHNEMGRGNMQGNSSPMVEEHAPVQGKYNLPQEFLTEQEVIKPVNDGPMTSDRINNSKLPDEIKRLMMEHPIQQPSMGAGNGTTLSNELIEKASRLMNTNAKGDLTESKRPQQPTQRQSVPDTDLREMMKEVVREVLGENGLLVESETKSNDLFKFRVGEHIFEGKILKVKKVTK